MSPAQSVFSSTVLSLIAMYAGVPAKILAASGFPFVAFQILHLFVSLVIPTKALVIDGFDDGFVGFTGGGTRLMRGKVAEVMDETGSCGSYFSIKHIS